MWVWIGLLAIVIAVVIYIRYYSPSGIKNTKAEAQQLAKQPEIGNTSAAQTVLFNSNTGTLQAFVYPLGYQRTGQLTMCSTTTPNAPGEPDCSTGRFNMCVCEGGSCDRCKHVGYVNVLNISNIVRLEMLTAPDASRQNMAGCQLVVRTIRNPLPPNVKQGMCPRGYYEFGPNQKGLCCPSEPTMNGTQCPTPAVDRKQICSLDAGTSEGYPLCPSQLPETGTILQEETMVLPNIPLQKWTMVTIAREGRRFDVYYNGTLVLSQRTQYMLANNATFGPITAGDPNLSGNVASVDVFAEKKTADQIAKMYTNLADTNGKPYLEDAFDPFKYIPWCEGGACLKGPTVRPSSPLMDWDTEYA